MATLELIWPQIRWVLVGILAGLAVPTVPFAVAQLHLVAAYQPLALFLMTLPFIVVPWVALRPSWPFWWLGSYVGLIVGFVGSVYVLDLRLRLITICFGIGAVGCQKTGGDGLAFLWFVVIALAAMGLLQALTVRGMTQKIGWFLTSLISAFVFPWGVVAAAIVLGQFPNPQWNAGFLAGAAGGLVIGLGLAMLTGRPLSSRQGLAA